MAALTLIMNELEDLNPEEFFNVRAYHSCSKDFRQYARQVAGAPASPTESESSGISSQTASSISSASLVSSSTTRTTSSEDETTTEESRSKGPWKVTIVKSKDEPQQESNIKQEDVKKNVCVYYCGRDILNLEINTQPLKWQLISPLFGFLNPYIFVNYRSYYRYDGDYLVEEYPMKTCEKCDFRQPLPDF